MLVKDMYQDCLIYEESTLAHYIYHLLAEKKISLDDDISKMDFNQADHLKVASMIQKKVLGFHKVGIHSLKMNQKAFVFIYAGSKEEAIQFYLESFHKAPLNLNIMEINMKLQTNTLLTYLLIRFL